MTLTCQDDPYTGRVKFNGFGGHADFYYGILSLTTSGRPRFSMAGDLRKIAVALQTHRSSSSTNLLITAFTWSFYGQPGILGKLGLIQELGVFWRRHLGCVPDGASIKFPEHTTPTPLDQQLLLVARHKDKALLSFLSLGYVTEKLNIKVLTIIGASTIVFTGT